MSPGTIVKLPDGREGTVVYHGPDGYGIRWGRISIDTDAINAGSGCQLIGVGPDVPDDYAWFPEAMLRSPYPSADCECVGDDYEVAR